MPKFSCVLIFWVGFSCDLYNDAPFDIGLLYCVVLLYFQFLGFAFNVNRALILLVPCMPNPPLIHFVGA